MLNSFPKDYSCHNDILAAIGKYDMFNLKFSFFDDGGLVNVYDGDVKKFVIIRRSTIDIIGHNGLRHIAASENIKFIVNNIGYKIPESLKEAMAETIENPTSYQYYNNFEKPLAKVKIQFSIINMLLILKFTPFYKPFVFAIIMSAFGAGFTNLGPNLPNLLDYGDILPAPVVYRLLAINGKTDLLLKKLKNSTDRQRFQYGLPCQGVFLEDAPFIAANHAVRSLSMILETKKMSVKYLTTFIESCFAEKFWHGIQLLHKYNYTKYIINVIERMMVPHAGAAYNESAYLYINLLDPLPASGFCQLFASMYYYGLLHAAIDLINYVPANMNLQILKYFARLNKTGIFHFLYNRMSLSSYDSEELINYVNNEGSFAILKIMEK